MNRDTNQNQGQEQDIEDIMNILNSSKNQDSNTVKIEPPPEQQARQEPDDFITPFVQISRPIPNQNRPVQQHRPAPGNTGIAPKRPAHSNFPANSSNPPGQAGQKPSAPRPDAGTGTGPAKNANMSDGFQSGHTKTFDTNRDIYAKPNPGPGANSPNANADRSRRETNDGTYHYTGRNIKSSRQKFAETESSNAYGRKTKTADEDDGNMTVSAARERNKRKNADISSKRSGFIMSGILKVVLYILGVLVISGIIAYNMIMIANDVFAFKKESVAFDVIIPQDVSIERISQILYDSQVIKYPKIFNFYINYKKKDALWEFEAGTYLVSSTMNYDTLIATFRKKAAERETIRIAIPEGFTIDQIIDKFVVENGIGTREKFLEAINETDFSSYGYRFLKPLYENKNKLSRERKYLLEGYIFPDTYDFYKDESEASIIQKFLDNFNSKFTEDFYNQCTLLDNAYKEATGQGMTIDDVITLASMIEREAKHPEDFEPISAVFHNRLLHRASFPRLQSDATVLYDYKEHKTDLTQADLAIDSPYNTYTRDGLPPSAICNPGYEAIFAALWPTENSPYYFFVANINTGEVYYGRTSAEHEANRAIAKAAGN